MSGREICFSIGGTARRFASFLLLAGFFISAAARSETFELGQTQMPGFSNAPTGRTIAVDSAGNVHMVFTKRMAFSPVCGMGYQHAYYNRWIPATREFVVPQSIQIMAPPTCWRTGMAAVALDRNGWDYVVCYLQPTASGEHPGICAGLDYLQGVGAFTTECARPWDENDPSTIMAWPRMAVDFNGDLQIVSAAYRTSGSPASLMLYSRVHPLFEGGAGYNVEWTDFGRADAQLIDSSQFGQPDITASSVSERVVRAWFAPRDGHWENPPIDADLMAQFSMDAGESWQNPVNVTSFIPPDPDCYEQTGNAACCNRDTLRPTGDLSLLFDNQDILHVAFTTIAYRQWFDGETGPFVQQSQTIIWHWSDATNEFSPAAVEWLADTALTGEHGLPGLHTIIERPSLARNPQNGYLYCSYLRYDPAAYSQAGNLNADVWISVSTDNGQTWSAGTDVTNTTPETIPAPPGGNRNEQQPMLAEVVIGDTLSLLYLLDMDADPLGETWNPMLYHRIGTDQIPTEPRLPTRDFHVTVIPCDTVNSVTHRTALETDFELHPAYPNPFNSRTTIRFDLASQMPVRLSVFDVLGREAAVLRDGEYSAGAYAVQWTAEDVSSGVYFVSLRAGGARQIQKVLLIR